MTIDAPSAPVRQRAPANASTPVPFKPPLHNQPASAAAAIRYRVTIVGRLDAPDLLLRVLGVLQRRRCTVVSVDFAVADRHRHGRLLIAYDAPAAHAAHTLGWLRALVDVLTVEPT